MSRLVNQTYFEWYEFDVNTVHILITTCTYEINVIVSMKESEYIVTYIQNFMCAYE